MVLSRTPFPKYIFLCCIPIQEYIMSKRREGSSLCFLIKKGSPPIFGNYWPKTVSFECPRAHTLFIQFFLYFNIEVLGINRYFLIQNPAYKPGTCASKSNFLSHCPSGFMLIRDTNLNRKGLGYMYCLSSTLSSL